MKLVQTSKPTGTYPSNSTVGGEGDGHEVRRKRLCVNEIHAHEQGSRETTQLNVPVCILW